MIKVNQDDCTGCGTCVDTCPVGAIELSDNVANVNSDTCTECEACTQACPLEAIYTD